LTAHLTALRGPLSRRTMATLRRYFDERDHDPSPDHWEALADVARTLEAMADGTASPNVYLSAIDPGVGKTQTLIHFARTLVASPEHAHVGMVICVGRLTEAQAIAEALEIPAGKLAVLTPSDKELSAMTDTPPNDAQVLVTTQQKIERATDGWSFGATGTFYYRGQPRQVRAWDEAFLWGAAVTLKSDDLLFLPKLIRLYSPECADAVTDFAVGLRHLQDGAAVDVPDFAATYGLSLHEVLATAVGATGRLRDDQQMAATALLTLNGHTARIRQDGRTGNTLLTYRDTLPEDLKPLLVLDASIRVRKTYALMQQHRGSMVKLKSAVKDYSPLTIHIWQTSGSKSGFEKNGDGLAKGIAMAILTKPTEQWLAVVHMTGGRVRDVDKAIRRHLPTEVSCNLKTITWGTHMARNDFSDVPNVILAGTLFMPQSFYTALTHMAQDRDVAPGLASSEEVAETVRGEHAHHCLQAICRGRVRRSKGAKCHPMSAYVIASARSGVPEDLATIFPGCSVVPWSPTKRNLQGHAKAALDYVRSAADRGEDWIAFTTIRTALGIRDKTNFRSRVQRLPDFIDAARALGFEVSTGPRGAKGLRRVAVSMAA
jgi:hypothetical protein